ncbi:MAG: PhoU domain-containing protein [candidate division Zixibacteria bacterium]|nr:PhoU domain-containing protein [candidate division Zixibacteria bacterium]
MFQKYLALFSKQNLLEKAFRRTVKMIEFDREMFEASVQVLRHSDESDMPFDIYEKDKALNKYEREVRRNVLTHLAVVGKGDIVAGLTLVSIVIDVERIGDYTKNIADLARDHPKRLEAGRHEKALAEIENKITERFTGFAKIVLVSALLLKK